MLRALVLTKSPQLSSDKKEQVQNYELNKN